MTMTLGATQKTQSNEQVQIPVPLDVSDSKLTKLIQSSIFQPDSMGVSLHSRVVKLPFYARLKSCEIKKKELLLHFVNLSAIFKKLEGCVAKHEVFQELVTANLFRHLQVEKDIDFFITEFGLTRPQITSETQEFLDFIDETEKQDPLHLLAILFVQFGGLFTGRSVCQSTIHWLKTKISNWENLPAENRGISYWSFKGLNAKEDGEKMKEIFDRNVNALCAEFQKKDLNIPKKLNTLAILSFQFNARSIHSITHTSEFISKTRNQPHESRSSKL